MDIIQLPLDFASSLETRFWSKVNKSTQENGCWLWTGAVSGSGYGHLSNGAGKNIQAHRFSYESEYGPIPKGHFVCHKCDVKICVRPTHLFSGTHGDNMADLASKGLTCIGDRNGARIHPDKIRRGEQHGSAKLTDATVNKIRQLYVTGQYRHKDLAYMFGVSQSLIAQVLLRQIWRHVA